ncbi:MAG: hypothetical protein IPG81_30260 [Sandaracinaceae bacterium]|nr:hypothetical protein [Sandaracinaceae bacterium]
MSWADKTPKATLHHASLCDASVMRRADELAVAPATAMTTAPPHSMHDDCGASDVGRIGPTAAQVELRYFQRKEGVLQMGGMCPGFGLDAEGHPLSITFTRKSAYVVRLHKDTLQPLNVHRIPHRNMRTSDAMFNPRRLFSQVAGGTYCFVDALGRLVVPLARSLVAPGGVSWNKNGVMVLAPNAIGGFDEQFLPATVPNAGNLIAVQPVHTSTPLAAGELPESGYWWVSDNGYVGIAVPDGCPPVSPLRLTHGGKPSRIENSFCSSARGAFVVSEHVMTRCAREADAVVLKWSYEYENWYRANGKSKFSGVTGASGTTPTLAGDYVVIGDAANPMNVVVLPQEAAGKANVPSAKVPVFAGLGGSECENSVIAFQGELIVVGNTYGYSNPLEMFRYEDVPGLTCLRMSADGKLTVAWERKDVNVVTSPPKASRRGVVYIYSRTVLEKPVPHGHASARPRVGRERWELLGLDLLNAGKTVYRVKVFEGDISKAHDNAWATMCLGDTALYLGMWHGALRIGDA